MLGDSLVRLMRFLNGKQVEVQNYIDNTGVEVADVVVGFCISVSDRRGDPPVGGPVRRPLLGRVRPRQIALRAGQGPGETRADVLKHLSEGGNDVAAMAEISLRIVNCHLDTMERLGSATTCCLGRATSCT